jgi:hypothetical protein
MGVPLTIATGADLSAPAAAAGVLGVLGVLGVPGALVDAEGLLVEAGAVPCGWQAANAASVHKIIILV